MISNELLEEVIYISSQGKFISKGLLLRIAINVIEKLDYVTKSKFQEVKFVDLDWDFGYAACTKSLGLIELDYQKLINQEKEAKVFSCLYANLSIIQYLLHEIEHLNEYYKVTKNDLQSKLINISSSDFLEDRIYDYFYNNGIDKDKIQDCVNESFQSFQEKYWQIIPLEKIADSDSYKNLLRSIKNYPNFINKYPNLYEKFVDEYLYTLKLGYKYDEQKNKYSIPILLYISALKKFDTNIKLSDIGYVLKESTKTTSKISLEEKLKYGFPTSKNEIDGLNKQKILI